jgi:hypothetical protein
MKEQATKTSFINERRKSHLLLSSEEVMSDDGMK